MTDEEELTPEMYRAFYKSWFDHKRKVFGYLQQFCDELQRRAYLHDDSKLSPEELTGFVQAQSKLATLTYGTEEYKQSLADLQDTLKHHYIINRHHPEHFENGVNGMTLIDVLEMLADWLAATDRVRNGDVWGSLEYNKIRFGLSDQLIHLLYNTLVHDLSY